LSREIRNIQTQKISDFLHSPSKKEIAPAIPEETIPEETIQTNT
jgi:hypothetical protein